MPGPFFPEVVMAKKPEFAGPTQLIDSGTNRPVRQYTMSGQYYVRATASRHFWGRVLDGVVFLAAFCVFSLLVVCTQLAMKNSPALWELAYEDSFFMALVALAWFPALYVYGMIWGKWGLFGDKAAHMRSVRIKDGTISGAWIGGWRAVAWSFFPFYVVLLIVSVFDGGMDHTPGYVPLGLDSGFAKGQAPFLNPSSVDGARAQAS
ncbi:hypothetical protein [Arthrobacter sp. H35-D1]|uniref:hypothetical protein n=1 Tax=Arthrobacter sp. H35-D1 TaxID=3046202 RepID=UPI0024B9A46A|nr:hypothetical protein [Arthrobacter sp. H35-D1]MDJ0312192.1 hypothetical protein [Arthrobacter sp. H35-D1]